MEECYHQLSLLAGLMAAGLLVFPVPTFLPAQYWLWHSIWHLVMFQGYWCASTSVPVAYARACVKTYLWPAA